MAGNIFVVKVVGMISLGSMRQQCIAIAPRNEPLETPIEDPIKRKLNTKGKIMVILL